MKLLSRYVREQADHIVLVENSVLRLCIDKEGVVSRYSG